MTKRWGRPCSVLPSAGGLSRFGGDRREDRAIWARVRWVLAHPVWAQTGQVPPSASTSTSEVSSVFMDDPLSLSDHRVFGTGQSVRNFRVPLEVLAPVCSIPPVRTGRLLPCALRNCPAKYDENFSRSSQILPISHGSITNSRPRQALRSSRSARQEKLVRQRPIGAHASRWSRAQPVDSRFGQVEEGWSSLARRRRPLRRSPALRPGRRGRAGRR